MMLRTKTIHAVKFHACSWHICSLSNKTNKPAQLFFVTDENGAVLITENNQKIIV